MHALSCVCCQGSNDSYAFGKGGSSFAVQAGERCAVAVAHLIFCKVPMELVHLVKGHCVKELLVKWYREVVSADI